MINILPTMAQLGRNSQLTQKLAITPKEKLSEKELRDFHSWLQAVEQERGIAVRAAQRNARGF